MEQAIDRYLPGGSSPRIYEASNRSTVPIKHHCNFFFSTVPVAGSIHTAAPEISLVRSYGVLASGVGREALPILQEPDMSVGNMLHVQQVCRREDVCEVPTYLVTAYSEDGEVIT